MEQIKREKGKLNTRYGKWLNLSALWLGISIAASLSVLAIISSSVLLWIELKQRVFFFLSFFLFVIFLLPLVFLIKITREKYKQGYHYTISGLSPTTASSKIAKLLKEENIKYRKISRELSTNHTLMKSFLSGIEEIYILEGAEINIIVRRRLLAHHKKRGIGTIIGIGKITSNNRDNVEELKKKISIHLKKA